MANESDTGSTAGLLDEAKEAFEQAVEAETDNRKEATDDVRFARLGEQWPADIRKEREMEGRPCMTFNFMPTSIRQVVNDARQNKPSIKVHPVDDAADPETADIYNGLIRNIEYTSDAEVAYDTATENAVSMGWGYFTVDIVNAHDDTFDTDIAIKAVPNAFNIYGDPNSLAYDSSDWNTAFEVEWLSSDAFKAQFPDASESDWDSQHRQDMWFSEDGVMIAKWWRREETSRTVLQLSNGEVIDAAILERNPELFGAFQVRQERTVKSWKVTRHILSGSEVLKSEPWAGKYIPIVPVYGDVVVDDRGKRHLRSLTRDAKDAQRNFNYQRTTGIELLALQPKVPWIGKKGTFKSDARRWSTANRENHSYLEYDGEPPQRMPLDMGPAAGALQEASNAQEDIKRIVGIFDPSIGAPSNETSGRAILLRQREGDVSTFHFQDNMSRAIRHAGRIVIDLIPKVYSQQRIVRVIGEDGTAENVKLNQPVPVKGKDGQPEMRPVMNPQTGQPMTGMNGAPVMEPVTRVYDLSVGKYDLTVTTGPSYTTKREEASVQMVQFMQGFPQAAPLIGDLLAKNLDWPGADEIAKRLKTMLPPQLQGGLPPEIQSQIEQGKQMLAQQGDMIKQMQAYILKLESDRTNAADKNKIDMFKAETDRLEALSKIQQQGVEVPDAPTASPYADYEGLVAAAEANKLDATAERERANAGLATARMIRELRPDPQPMQMPQRMGMPQPRTF